MNKATQRWKYLQKDRQRAAKKGQRVLIKHDKGRVSQYRDNGEIWLQPDSAEEKTFFGRANRKASVLAVLRHEVGHAGLYDATPATAKQKARYLATYGPRFRKQAAHLTRQVDRDRMYRTSGRMLRGLTGRQKEEVLAWKNAIRDSPSHRVGAAMPRALATYFAETDAATGQPTARSTAKLSQAVQTLSRYGRMLRHLSAKQLAQRKAAGKSSAMKRRRRA